MNAADWHATTRIANSFKTRSITDRAAQAMLLRSARTASERIIIEEIILRARLEWFTYLTVTQRYWQTKARRPSRAVHHDSVAIREAYVRCGATK